MVFRDHFGHVLMHFSAPITLKSILKFPKKSKIKTYAWKSNENQRILIPTKYFGRVFRTVQRFEYSALMIGFEVLSKIPFKIENDRIPILIKRIISERSIIMYQCGQSSCAVYFFGFSTPFPPSIAFWRFPFKLTPLTNSWPPSPPQNRPDPLPPAQGGRGSPWGKNTLLENTQ